MKCPKCGFDQPEDIFCANCGVDVSSFKQKRGSEKKKFATAGVVAAIAVAVVSILLIWLMLPGNEAPTIVDDPLSASRVSVGAGEEHGDGNPEQTAQTPEDTVETDSAPDLLDTSEPPPGAGDSKPIPPTVLQADIKREGNLVQIPIASIGGERSEYRVAAIENGFPRDIVFQIDGGWDDGGEDEVRDTDVLWVRSEDIGDRDDHTAAPRNGEQAWVAEVDSPEGGRGWVYIYRSYNPRSTAEGKYITFTTAPEAVSTKNYIISFNPQSQFVVDDFRVSGLSLLDRMKIRLSTVDFVLDESMIYSRPGRSSGGPLMARYKASGVIERDDIEIPVTRSDVYFPDRIELFYNFDFPSDGLVDPILRIYFDLSEEGYGLKLVTTDLPNGKTVNGGGGASEHDGSWFIIDGPEKSVRVTLLTGSGKLIFIDDTSVEDPPESFPGCMGCPGFEFSDPTGRLELGFSFEILDWKSGDGDPPPDIDFLKASVSRYK